MSDPVAIDASLARRLIDSQFPQWSQLQIAAVEFDGWDNRTFRLGPELAVRLPSGDWGARLRVPVPVDGVPLARR